MSTTAKNLMQAALVGTGVVVSYLIGERRGRAIRINPVPDPSNVALLEAINRLEKRLPETYPDVAKIITETTDYVAKSRLSIKTLLLTGSVISFSVGAVVFWVVPKITLALLSWMGNKKSPPDTKPRVNPIPAEANPVLNVTEDLHAAQPVNVVFHVASARLLATDLEQLRQRITSHFAPRLALNITILGTDDTAELSALAPQLIFRFEMVDDRIRELPSKAAESSSLFALTNNNCVWVFVCYKPTDNTDGTSIKNSLKDCAGFRSGYVNKRNEKVDRWLQYEYKINSTVTDAKGNMRHDILNKELVQQEIQDIISSVQFN